MNTNYFVRLFVSVALGVCNSASLLAADKVDFNRDVRPILSENCFHCHGFDEKHRAADLRLDTLEGAIDSSRGSPAIVPGDAKASELVVRIFSTDDDAVMPPRDSRRSLTEKQKEILQRWIEQGAAYDKHWAFQSPNATATDKSIDQWIRNTLDVKLWAPLNATTPEKWLRRASFDLIGLAPSPSQADAFLESVKTKGEQAYVEAVDTLLASPRYGERMAQDWLDAARYADTHGFNNDSQRSMWRWRDWVIESFNRNLPYDQFLTKQLAGDLLPNPSLDDLIATGYCRNHVINSEGGIIDEEYRVEYVVDRVRTLGTSVMGLTLECARCHDHKFDPITQKDFYRLFAFFNQVAEIGEDGRIANAVPMIPAPTRDEQESIADLDVRMEAISQEMSKLLERLTNVVRVDKSDEAISKFEFWNSELLPLESLSAGEHPISTSGKLRIEKTVFGPSYSTLDSSTVVGWELPNDAKDMGKPWTFSVWVRWDGKPVVLASSMRLGIDPSAANYGNGLGIEINESGAVEVRLGKRWPAYFNHVVGAKAIQKGSWTNVVVQHDGSTSAAGLSIFLNGEICRNDIRTDGAERKSAFPVSGLLRLGSHDSPNAKANPTTLAAPRLIPKLIDEADILTEADRLRIRFLSTLAKRTKEEEIALYQLHFWNRASALFDERYASLRLEKLKLERERQQLIRSAATTMVMADQPTPRETFVLVRGQYNAPGERVEAGVPEELLAAWPKQAPKNRLGLAQWLTQPEHPLTSRVAVNRYWQHLFGTGLVKSAEDFGLQGEFPSHPELLDKLARDFVKSGWDVKGLMKQLVLTEAYRRDSRVPTELKEADPENRYLARGPRFRLPAENIRDHLLDVGGLLQHRKGGASVFPTQPPDLYKGIVVDAPYPGTKWTDSIGDDLYRRSVYTFWKRTVPYPVLSVFDAPDREVCVARRSKTNTPLQALTLMNEPSMLEAARGLAKRMQQDGLAMGFRLSTGRAASERELKALVALEAKLTKDFEENSSDAIKLLNEKEASDKRIAERAALVAVANVILNLDETITKD